MTANQHQQRPYNIRSVFALRVALCLSTLASFTLSAAAVSAQSASDSATAQALFDRGKKLMGAGNYAEACPALEESERVESRSGTALNLADCYEHAGRLASAWSMFLDAASLAKATANTAREYGARQRAAALAQRLSHLVINASFAASTPGLEITRDGERVGSAQWGVPLPADAGKHTISASAPGRKQWQTSLNVPNGPGTANVAVPDLENSTVEATPVEPAPSVAPARAVASPLPESASQQLASSRIDAGVIACGVATGVLAVGTIVTAALYKAKLHDYDAANERLSANRDDLHSQTRSLGVANLLFLSGTVVAASVTVLLWTRAPVREQSKAANVELRGMVGPGLTGLIVGGRL
jgi:tetratricopeptide (TPR) repeat protein